MSMSAAPTSGLLKAKRLMDGEDPEDVLPRQTAPKTNSFYQNIAEPDKYGPVTIDGRAHDIAVNQLRSWPQDRGINTAALKSGKTSRYEHFEGAYRAATAALNEQHGDSLLPHEVQAVTWEQGKHLEHLGTTKSGKPRSLGIRRQGQPYLGPNGLLPKP